MLSWKIFKHSVSMVFNNFGTAIRLASPLIAVMVLMLVVFGPEIITGDYDFDPYTSMPSEAGVTFAIVVSTLLQIIASLWVAVAWHRFILLEEGANGFLPSFNGSRILAYFGWGLLLFIIMAVVGGVVGAAGGLIMVMGSAVTGILGVAIIVAAVVLSIVLSARLYIILPAAAVGSDMTLKGAWDATRGYTGTVVLAYVFFILIAIVIGGVIGFLSVFLGIIGAVIMIAIEVVFTLIGFSFLTTLYGIIVENREIS